VKFVTLTKAENQKPVSVNGSAVTYMEKPHGANPETRIYFLDRDSIDVEESIKTIEARFKGINMQSELKTETVNYCIITLKLTEEEAYNFKTEYADFESIEEPRNTGPALETALHYVDKALNNLPF